MLIRGIANTGRPKRTIVVLVSLLASAWCVPYAAAFSSFTAIGDSITDGYRVSKGYPARLGGMIGKTVYEEGVGGETTGGGLRRIQSVINKHHPTHMLIMFGTNDVNSGPRDLSGSARNIRDMARICRDNHVVPIVATIPPFVSPVAEKNSRVRDFNNLVRGAASGGDTADDYFIADVGSAFGSGSGLMQSDGFHPNDNGQQVIANTFFPRTSLPPVAGKATLIAPSGDVTSTRRPEFRWDSVSDATWYYVLVQRDGAKVADKWIEGGTSWTFDFDFACGSFSWWVMTWNQSGDGRWSSRMDFRYNGPDCCFPEQVDGLTHVYAGNAAIEYYWKADACADENQVIVHRDGSPWKDAWYDANPVGNGTWDKVTLGSHPFGEYTFWVRPSGTDGTGAWSDGYSFHYGLAAPEAPTGTITDRQPRFWWDDSASADSTWYHIWIKRNGQTYLTRWVSKAETAQSGDFRYYDFPADVVFKYGAYTWWIQSYKQNDYGPWSSGASFDIPQDTPDASNPVSPNGVTTDTRRPAFTWSQVNNADWYQLLLHRNGSPYLNKWIEGLTSWTPDKDLPEGFYSWWMQTWNEDGFGPWSGKATVQVPSLKPEPSTPLSPVGTAGSGSPPFSWSAADRATWYHVLIYRSGSPYYDKWFNDTTPFTPWWDFAAGNYRWWVQSYGDYGYGKWSSPADFTVP